MACEYFKNPEATAKCFKDGWFYPGDRGRLNKNGLLFLTGRQSEIVAKEDFDIPALHSGLVKKFGAPVCFVRVKQIPRNQMGKVVRGQLRGRLSAILAEHERRTGTQVPNV